MHVSCETGNQCMHDLGIMLSDAVQDTIPFVTQERYAPVS